MEAVYALSKHFILLLRHTKLFANCCFQENPLLREIFGLGSPIPDGTPVQKLSKNDKVPTVTMQYSHMHYGRIQYSTHTIQMFMSHEHLCHMNIYVTCAILTSAILI